MKTCYISGKITGLPKEEYTDNFELAESVLRATGFNAINPVKLWHPVKCWIGYLAVDILVLLFCDCIYFMDNWTESKGSIVEYKVSMFLRKKIVQL